ncbi:MAG: DnaJ domain-containing protein [Alphaproteobacteria bacterium]|nr:DnaJ domain-containing protein [Alphaproteobacteria bacterium]
MKKPFPLFVRLLWLGLQFGVCLFLSASPADAASYFVTASVLNLRSCKGTNCKITAQLTFGEIVDVSEDDGSWVKVKTRKGNGYVAKKYLKKATTPSESNGNGFFFYGFLFACIATVVFNRKKEKTLSQKAPDDNKNISLYDLLGIGAEATSNEIKKAYKELAKKYHPDVNPDRTDAAERFREITKAYETLKDKQKRAVYDASLKTSQAEDFSEKTLLSPAGSIQELRGMLAEKLNVPWRAILFTRNGNVFIDQQYAFRWRPVEQVRVIDRKYRIKTLFECYRPINPYPDERDSFELEIIVLTAPDILGFKRRLGIYFDREEKRISLADDGRVYVDGIPDWLWHYSDNGYFEYYFSTGDI